MNKQTKNQTQIRNTTKQLTHKQTKKTPFPKDPCKVSMPSLVSFSNRKKPQTTQAKTQPETIHKKKINKCTKMYFLVRKETHGSLQ